MKIRREKGYILVISPRIVYFAALTTGLPSLARAAAFFPFIFVRSEEVIEPWLINHERIHFRQQVETALIGMIILSTIETLYALLFLKKTPDEAYLWRSCEQEAYRNQNNANYLKNRKTWTLFHYLKNKRTFTFGRPGEIIFTDNTSA